MIGKTIAQYEVLARIGEGGMGEVYRARDTRLDREVALKVLPPAFAKDPERLARFRREARLLASLNHTHIAALHGLEEVDGEVFLAMELIEGEDLAERLRRGPIEPDEAMEFARQLAEGLEAAHEQNIVHRDLKPANLKVNPDGQLKILDFGLARAYLGDPGEPENLEQSPTITAALTGQGVILGTAAYMSPEQARGRKIDQRTDIWAFGAILFEMLTGQRVFQGETISDTMAAVLRAEPPWDSLPSGTPHGVRRLLERCLERDARRRLRDIGEARVRLERWRDDPASADESYVTGVVVPRETSRQGILPWALCGLAILAAGFLGWRLSSQEPVATPVLDFGIRVEQDEQFAVAGRLSMISPDGNWICWNTEAGIYVRELARDNTRLLEGTDATEALCFSPDSKWLAFAGRGELRRVSISGGRSILVAEMPTPRGITWVDANTIVFAASIAEGLEQVNIRDGVASDLTTLDHARNERSHRWPTRVPGRRAVLFECQFLGTDYDQSDVEMVSLDTGKRTVLHRGGGAPVVTAQGQLLFVRGQTIFAGRVDLERGEIVDLPVPVREHVMAYVGDQETDDGSAQYSVDDSGNLLFVESAGQVSVLSRLAWMDVKSGSIEPFGPAARYRGLRISPDGKLAVVARAGAGENLYVRDLANNNETLLTRRRGVEYAGCWSADSRTYYWSQGSEAGTEYEIWRRSVDGTGPPERVLVSPGAAGGFYASSVSPDGRYLAATMWGGATLRDVLVVDLQDPEREPQIFAGTGQHESDPRWFGPNYLAYFEDQNSVGRIVVRHFPDTGSVWTFPEVDQYWDVSLTADSRAAIVFGQRGIYRFPLEFGDDGIVIGQSETLHVWTDEENRRNRDPVYDPVSGRLLVVHAEGPATTAIQPTLHLVTGFADELNQRLELGR